MRRNETKTMDIATRAGTIDHSWKLALVGETKIGLKRALGNGVGDELGGMCPVGRVRRRLGDVAKCLPTGQAALEADIGMDGRG